MAQKLQFPLSDQQEYKGRVTFSAFTDYVSTLSDLDLMTGYADVKKAVTDDRSWFERVGDVASSAFSSATTFVGDLADNFTGNNQKTYQTSKPVVQEQRGSVSLFLPSGLQIADGVEYSTTTLNFRGAVAAAGFRAAGGADIRGLAMQAAQTVGGDIESLFDNAAAGAAANKEILLRRILGRGGELSGAIETETGVALNPNRRSALGGINIRRFQFQFKLIPNSYEESQAVKEIIKFFRIEMYPEPAAVISEQSNVSAALRYPSKFKIGFTYDGKKIATGILPCFLENFTATYNPTNMSFHKGGDFQEVDITLSFLEERPLTRKDVLEDYSR